MDWPYVGDDIGFLHWMSDWVASPDWTLRDHLVNMWGFNGRMIEALNFLLFLVFPRPLTAALCAVGAASALWFAFKLCSTGEGKWRRAPYVMIALLLIVPWAWMLRLVLQFNYVWGAAVVMPVLYLVLRREPRSPWWLLLTPVAFGGAGAHEALGLPLMLGFIVYFLWRGRKARRFSAVAWALIISLMAGGLVDTLSPGHYSRLADTLNDGQGFSFTYILAWGVVWFIFPATRLLLMDPGSRQKLVCSVWCIFAVAAVTSFALTVAGKCLGYSRFYYCLFIVIILCYPAPGARYRLPRRLTAPRPLAASLLCLLLSAVYVVYLRDANARLHSAIAYYNRHPETPEAVWRLLQVPTIDGYELSRMPLLRGEPALDFAVADSLCGEAYKFGRGQ